MKVKLEEKLNKEQTIKVDEKMKVDEKIKVEYIASKSYRHADTRLLNFFENMRKICLAFELKLGKTCFLIFFF